MYDFFISHSSEDKDSIVDPLVSMLQNRGYKVWYDKNEIQVGDNIFTQIKNGLEESYCLLLILTNNFVEKIWTIYETASYDSNKNGTIIPIIYNISSQNQTKIFEVIGNKRYIDANKSSEEQIINELLYTLSKSKNDNKDLVCRNNLKTLQRKIASVETANTDLVSLKLKEYFDFVENHVDFVVPSAQAVVSEVVISLLEYQNYIIKPADKNSEDLYNIIVKNKIGNSVFRKSVNYIFSLKTTANYRTEINLINISLENILTYFLHTRYPIISTQSKIEVVYPDDLKYNDFIDMYEIDKKVMRADLVADVETTYGWFKYNKYTHIAVRTIDNQRIVGYFSILPINEETYNLILKGDFQDKDFNEDSIVQYIFSDFYRIYVAGVGIDPQYQNTNAFIMLYNALIDILISLAKDREIYISEILAEASTKQGEKFCKMVGMKKITHTPNETDVYGLVTIPPQFRFNNHKGKELFNLCQEKFEEFRDKFEEK